MSDLFAEKAQDWDANEKKTNLAASIGASIFQHVDIQPSMSVLDFGAGTGLIAAQIAARVQRMVALDTSAAMLAKLAAKPELENKVTVACQDIIEQPLDERFDLIVSAMALHHVEDTAGLLRQFYAHLNQPGTVAIADLDREDGSFHPPGTEGVFHSGFDRADLGTLFEQAGFSEVDFSTAHVFKGETQDYPIFLVTAKKT